MLVFSKIFIVTMSVHLIACRSSHSMAFLPLDFTPANWWQHPGQGAMIAGSAFALRRRKNIGTTTSRAAMISSASEIGWVREEHRQGHPGLIESARRNCCFGKRAQDQADDARGDGHIQHPHAETEKADDLEDDEVGDVVVERVGAQRREHQDARVQLRRESGAPSPTRERAAGQDQEHVAYEQARNHAPDQRGIAVEELGSWLEAVLLEGGEQDGRQWPRWAGRTRSGRARPLRRHCWRPPVGPRPQSHPCRTPRGFFARRFSVR